MCFCRFSYMSNPMAYSDLRYAYLSTLPFSPGNSVIICPAVFPFTYFPLNLPCFPSGPAGGSTVVVVPQVCMKIREIRDSRGIPFISSFKFHFIQTEIKHGRYMTGGLFLEWQLNESELCYQLVVEFSQHMRTRLTGRVSCCVLHV